MPLPRRAVLVWRRRDAGYESAGSAALPVACRSSRRPAAVGARKAPCKAGTQEAQ